MEFKYIHGRKLVGAELQSHIYCLMSSLNQYADDTALYAIAAGDFVSVTQSF